MSYIKNSLPPLNRCEVKCMLNKFNLFLDKLLKAIMITSGIFITVTVFIAVVLRYIFEMDLYAIDEFQMLAAYWFYFISAAYASSHGKQITSDIITFVLKKESSKLFVSLLVNIISALVLLIFAYWSRDLVTFAITASQKTQVWQISMVFYYFPVVLGLSLMVIFAFRDLASCIYEIVDFNKKQKQVN